MKRATLVVLLVFALLACLLPSAVAGGGDYSCADGPCPSCHKEEFGENQWTVTWTAPEGTVINKLVAKTGQVIREYTTNGTHDECYVVSGIGTRVATITQVCESNVYQQISHVRFFYDCATPPPPPPPPPPPGCPDLTVSLIQTYREGGIFHFLATIKNNSQEVVDVTGEFDIPVGSEFTYGYGPVFFEFEDVEPGGTRELDNIIVLTSQEWPESEQCIVLHMLVMAGEGCEYEASETICPEGTPPPPPPGRERVDISFLGEGFWEGAYAWVFVRRSGTNDAWSPYMVDGKPVILYFAVDTVHNEPASLLTLWLSPGERLDVKIVAFPGRGQNPPCWFVILWQGEGPCDREPTNELIILGVHAGSFFKDSFHYQVVNGCDPNWKDDCGK